ncbi:MAG: hypothetical protein M1827_000861 [Pycnora praestabilis]|nr:MAG: hypothetical protein M1827_000861 [Pycnora praestabilis]
MAAPAANEDAAREWENFSKAAGSQTISLPWSPPPPPPTWALTIWIAYTKQWSLTGNDGYNLLSINRTPTLSTDDQCLAFSDPTEALDIVVQNLLAARLDVGRARQLRVDLGLANPAHSNLNTTGDRDGGKNGDISDVEKLYKRVQASTEVAIMLLNGASGETGALTWLEGEGQTYGRG